MKNNLEILQEFIKKEKGQLLINNINEEITILYLSLIEFFAKKIHIKINKFEDNLQNIQSNLFEEKKLFIKFRKKQIEIEEDLKSSYLTIIFTEYRIFKKYSKNLLNINTYNFEKDILFFLKNILGINDYALFNNCLNNKVSTISEVSKYFITGKVEPMNKNDDTSKIQKIRSDYSKIIQKPNINLIESYNLLKNEFIYKKFNFLTF